MSDQEKIIEAFTRMAPRYEEVVDSELNQFWGWSYRGFIEKLFEASPINRDDLVLDIATGTGVIPEKLAVEGHTTNPIHGLDITKAMLDHATSRFETAGICARVKLVCASAMDLPYAGATFTQLFCGLATHHMSVERLVGESQRVLRAGGRLSIADAGGALSWKIPGVKLLLKIAAFIYFSLVEDLSRAMSEAAAVSNVRSREEWVSILETAGFVDISVTRLDSRYSWIPAPLIINAVKSGGGTL